MKKFNRAFGATLLLAIVAIIAVIFFFNQMYIDILWFKEVNYLDVYLKEVVTKAKLGVPIFLISFIVLSVYFKSLFTILGKKKVVVEDEAGKKKKNSKIYLVFALGLSVVFTFAAVSSGWYTFLEFTNKTAFGVKDPIFNKDISFYVFEVPFYKTILNLIFGLLAMLVISTFICSPIVKASGYIGTDKELRQKGLFKGIWDTFRKQLSVFLVVFFLLLAGNFYLEMFSILNSSTGVVYGATYSDINVTLNIYRVIIALCVVLAFASVAFVMKGKIKLLAFGGIVLVGALFLGSGIKLIVEEYVVSPNQYNLESKYIQNNIDFTRKAYGLEDVEVKEFSASQVLTQSDIEENSGTVNNIPINDFAPTLEMYNSIQGFRLYYTFHDVDVDRYNIDEGYRQVFLGVREMDNSKLAKEAQTWINLHTKYTHGYGTVMSTVNKVNSSGQPVLLQENIPTQTVEENLKLEEPRVYFGELTDTYAITNCVSPEFDYPEGSANKENYYEGSAGIPMTLFNKIVFSLNTQNVRILLSSEITNDSKILIRRNISERVKTIAPFLEYESDPYVVVNDGRLYWIIDAFTSTDRYPYSTPYTKDDTTFNYIRNSVKVVVDAYNGDVSYYLMDEDDPLAKTYSKIYPNLFKPISEMPDGLREHIRYSDLLFNVQAKVYNTYHMTNVQVFYNKEDQWEIATQFYDTSKKASTLNATYSVMKLPDRDEEFLIMIPFTPQNKDNMIGWMAGICDGDDYGKLIVYECPKQKLVYGPMQIEQRIEQDTIIAPQLTLLSQQGSEVVRGNLLTIPIEDGIIYVEPIYIRSSGGERSLPEVKKVIVAYGDYVIMADSLGEGLSQIFGSNPNLGSSGSSDSTEGGSTSDSSSGLSQKELVEKANTLLSEAEQAQKSGDWALYGTKISELRNVLNQLKQLAQ